MDPGPDFRWPVAVDGPIAATPERVWEVISSPGNLELCHPFCAANPVRAWPGATSRDEIHYLSGLVFERRFCRWIEGEGYDLHVGRPEGSASFVSWRIAPGTVGDSVLGISVYPHILQDWPSALRWLPYRLRVQPLLERYLWSVVRGFEWYLTRGEPVPRNQFGPHPWFSAPC